MMIPYEIVLLGWHGIIYIAMSGFFWILTENLCNKYHFIKYMFGHVWWHMGVSYGGYMVSLIPCYIYMQELHRWNNLKNYNRHNKIIKIKYNSFYIPYLIFYNSFYSSNV